MVVSGDKHSPLLTGQIQLELQSLPPKHTKLQRKSCCFFFFNIYIQTCKILCRYSLVLEHLVCLFFSSFSLSLCYQPIWHPALHKSSILQDWTQVGTYKQLQEINRNTKFIFKPECEPLGTPCEVREQRKEHSRLTSHLVSSGFSYNC